MIWTCTQQRRAGRCRRVITTSVGKGAGLSLFINCGHIKSLGGCIEVNSEKGVGTTITIMVLKTKNRG